MDIIEEVVKFSIEHKSAVVMCIISAIIVVLVFLYLKISEEKKENKKH